MYSLKIRAYVFSIINQNKIKIEINDEESFEKIENIIKKLQKEKKYKVPVDKCNNHLYYINLNKNTKFIFNNINYNNLQDLIGMELFISFNIKYYNFIIESINEKNEKIINYHNGYNFNATKLTNLKLYN